MILPFHLDQLCKEQDDISSDMLLVNTQINQRHDIADDPETVRSMASFLFKVTATGTILAIAEPVSTMVSLYGFYDLSGP